MEPGPKSGGSMEPSPKSGTSGEPLGKLKTVVKLSSDRRAHCRCEHDQGEDISDAVEGWSEVDTA